LKADKKSRKTTLELAIEEVCYCKNNASDQTLNSPLESLNSKGEFGFGSQVIHMYTVLAGSPSRKGHSEFGVRGVQKIHALFHVQMYIHVAVTHQVIIVQLYNFFMWNGFSCPCILDHSKLMMNFTGS